MLMRPCHLLAALALASAPRAALDVLVVDDSGGAGVDFTSLTAAVAAAQDGDVVLVRTGAYAGDTVVAGKSLVITADAGAEVTHAGRIAFQDLAAGQWGLLSGIAITPPGGFSLGGLEVLSCAGIVHVVDVAVTADPIVFAPHLVGVQDSAAVFLTRVTVVGGTELSPANEGIWAQDSALHLYDCDVTGGFAYGGLGGKDGGHGVVLDGGSLFASSSTFQGGPGKATGSDLFGCTGTSGGGGDGLVLKGTDPLADLFDTVLAGGAPGALIGTGDCTPGPAGDPLVVSSGTVDQTAWPERHFVVSTPVRTDEPVSATLVGQPGDLAWIVFSTQPAALPVAAVVGPLAVGAPVLVPVGPLPTGTLAFTAATFVPPGLEALVYRAQPLFVDALGATLGEPAAIVEIDAAF